MRQQTRLHSSRRHRSFHQDVQTVCTSNSTDTRNHSNLTYTHTYTCYCVPPARGEEYCHQPVRLCVCLCVCEHISGTAGPIGTEFCVQIPCARGSVLLRRRCDTLCAFGFMDDVTFGRNGRDAGKGWQHSALVINYVRDRGRV